jgi:uncharacterized RDD family membrane protein YckC
MSPPHQTTEVSTRSQRRGLRLVREEEGSPFPKASLLLRTGARLVDCMVALGLYQVTGPAGMVIALLYLLFADGMLQGQSAGKKIFGVKVIHLPTRSAARYRDSVLRNAPFGLVVILAMMPSLGERAFFAGLMVIGGVEAWKTFRDELGMRLGDAWAQTQVVDGKVVAGATLPRPMDTARAPGRVMLEGNEPPRSSRDLEDGPI